MTTDSELMQVEGTPVKIKIEKLVSTANLAKLLSDEQLFCIGRDAVQGYQEDRFTRIEWENRMQDAIKLALQFKEGKSFPWDGASNVKFPLVTVAALQFLARMAILTKGRQIVKCDVIGHDPDGKEFARASRVGLHMSYQLVEEDMEWMNDDEKAKFSASIMGCSFKKSYFDPVQGTNISEYVPAADLVVDYYTKTMEKANRVTQVLTMTANDVQERVRRGVFLEMDSDRTSVPTTSNLNETADEVQGIARPASSTIAAYEILEQHCFLDLDNDGYQEPYIVFVRSDTSQVLRIVARFFNESDVFRVHDAAVRRLRTNATTTDNEAAKAVYVEEALKLERASDNHIVRIEPQNFFTKFTFIPSIDGGFYDLGFGALLGPMNETVNTLINQQVDAGTMQVTAGGFLGRGVKIKGGKNSFDPFEWKTVDSNGDDLRKNIVPLPVNAPSSVLFQLLGMMISYGEKISGATDIMTGVSPGQNTPAETSRNTIEQGMKLFSGIYGRMHRAQTAEFRKLYRLNQLFLDTTAQYVSLSQGVGALIAHDDYKKGLFKVRPAADVEVTSEGQRQLKATMVLQAAKSSPGFDVYLANKLWLEAYDIQGIEQLLPDPKGPNAIPVPPNQELELKKQELQLEQQQNQQDWKKTVMELQQAADLNAAKISKLQADAELALSQADGIDTGHQIAAINAQTGAAKAHQEGLAKALTILQRTVDQNQNQQKIHHAAAAAQASAKEQGNGNNATGSAGVGAASGDAGISADTAGQ